MCHFVGSDMCHFVDCNYVPFCWLVNNCYFIFLVYYFFPSCLTKDPSLVGTLINFLFTTWNDIHVILIIIIYRIYYPLFFNYISIYNQSYIWTYILPVHLYIFSGCMEEDGFFFSDIKVLLSKFPRSSCMSDS